MSELVDMLKWKRPAWSWSEEGFIDTYVDDLPGVYADDYGNRIVDVGDAPCVLWSCHTDSVHDTPGFQELTVSRDRVKLRHPYECLGADCATGVYIARRLILARVPGRYVFHRNEENGCHGSYYILHETPELLEGIDYAIAFDRRGYDSVVTEQCGLRTASDTFAIALADNLALGMHPDPGGLFTDTEVYTEVVPECTNLSVGYSHPHTEHETQDLGFAEALVRALARLDVDDLPVDRDPADYGYAWEETWRRGDTSSAYTQADNECGICGTPIDPWDFTSVYDGKDVCEVCTAWLVDDTSPPVFKVHGFNDDPKVIPIKKVV